MSTATNDDISELPSLVSCKTVTIVDVPVGRDMNETAAERNIHTHVHAAVWGYLTGDITRAVDLLHQVTLTYGPVGMGKAACVLADVVLRHVPRDQLRDDAVIRPQLNLRDVANEQRRLCAAAIDTTTEILTSAALRDDRRFGAALNRARALPVAVLAVLAQEAAAVVERGSELSGEASDAWHALV
ncbi:hypothetical protein AB0I53_32690 [Saccharopolyspora sp. NPDC050389]|uniref:hypothetical protein n=1 Tax=Saccharopolyspora sp. NPDC050389 TaxID=3155516 RepID=UPI0034023528